MNVRSVALEDRRLASSTKKRRRAQQHPSTCSRICRQAHQAPIARIACLACLCDKEDVPANTIIRVVVAICLLAGLMTGQASFAASYHATTSSSTAMPRDMDCCPKKQSVPRCARCPLMALCSSPFTERLVDIPLPRVFARTIRRATPVDEAVRSGRSAPPLPEPPRSSV